MAEAALKEWDEPQAPPADAEAGGDDVAVAETPTEAAAPAALDDSTSIAADIHRWAEGQAKLALQLPDPRARVLAQQNIEASMRQMWETAFPDPAAYRANASAYVRKAIDRRHKEARRPRVDPDATADRFAVVAAMKGASGKPAPEKPPDLTRMTDGEFKRYTEQFF